MSDDQAALRSHVEVLACSPRNGRSAPGHLASCAEYVAAFLADRGWNVTRDRFTLQHQLGLADQPNPWWPFAWHAGLTGENVLAEWGDEGSPLVLLAHLDTVGRSPGADDNGSGVAALLEAARLISQAGGRRRVLAAVVDLEETGHQGSVRLARALQQTHSIRAAICLESIGYFDDRPGSQRFPGVFRGLLVDPQPPSKPAGDFLAIISRGSSAQLAAEWASHARHHGLKTLRFLDPRPDGSARGASLLRPYLLELDRSDHASFQRRGTPAVLITDTANLRNPHYHRATDAPDTLDYRRLAAATAATAALLQGVALGVGGTRGG